VNSSPARYQFKAVKASPHGGQEAFYAQVRRNDWADGYWLTIANRFGNKISYMTREYAIAAAEYWAVQHGMNVNE
jgi:hypothetical protein